MGLVQKPFTQKMSTELARQIQKRDNYKVYIIQKTYNKVNYKVRYKDEIEKTDKYMEDKNVIHETLTSKEFDHNYKGKRTIKGISDFLYKYMNIKVTRLWKRILYKDFYYGIWEIVTLRGEVVHKIVDYYYGAYEGEEYVYLTKLQVEERVKDGKRFVYPVTKGVFDYDFSKFDKGMFDKVSKEDIGKYKKGEYREYEEVGKTVHGTMLDKWDGDGIEEVLYGR